MFAIAWVLKKKDADANDMPPVQLHIVDDVQLRHQVDLSSYTVQQAVALLAGYAAKGPLVMSVDAYQILVLEQMVIAPEQVDMVLPLALDEQVPELPFLSAEAAAICRAVPFYYHMMSQMPVVDHTGERHCYRYTVANTVSLRARAAYQNIDMEKRQQFHPVEPGTMVLAFDWKAAEFSLIIQIAGDDLPDGDAYAPLIGDGVARDTAKDFALKYIYGARETTLIENFSEAVVVRLRARLNAQFPKVMALINRSKDMKEFRFEGFGISLGDEPHKRPNRLVQTALQVCKWELISRLTNIGCAHLAAGDMHDSLIFHVRPEQVDLAKLIIAEARKPIFGRYHLTAEFGDQILSHWR